MLLKGVNESLHLLNFGFLEFYQEQIALALGTRETKTFIIVECYNGTEIATIFN